VRGWIAHFALYRVARARTADLFDAASTAPPVDAVGLRVGAVLVEGVLVDDEHGMAHFARHKVD